MPGVTCGAGMRRAVAGAAVRRARMRLREVVGRVRGTCRDAGMATVEYAVVTLAAAGFAGLLALVLRSDEVRGMLTDLIHRALNQ